MPERTTDERIVELLAEKERTLDKVLEAWLLEDLCFEYTVQPPSYLGTWEFEYSGKPRLAFVMKSSPGAGGFVSLTPDGWRTFKPAKMIGITDVTTIGD